MASKKQESQEPTAIDNLNSQLTSASEKIANNKKIIYWCFGAILVVGAFTLSYLFIYRNPRVNEAFEAYNAVETVAMGSDSISAAEYIKVANEYGSSDAGKLAALSAGEALYNQGKYKEAAEYLKKFSSSDNVLSSNVMILTADCYVNLKQYDEALDYYTKAVREADGNPQIVPRALLKQANVYDEQKKYDKALGCYEIIANDYPEFQFGNGMTAEAYVAREKARLGK